MLMFTAVVFYLATCTDGSLTSSQPTCIGDVVEYNCSYEDNGLLWSYNDIIIHSFNLNIGFLEVKVNISEILFDLSFNTSGMIIMSTLRFKASEASNNLPILCEGGIRTNTDTKVIEIIPPGIIPNITDAGRLNISVDVVINITWTGSMDVDNYTINCPNGECNSQYILGNITSTTIRLIKNVTSLVICVTATNACGPLPFCARIVLGNDGQVIIVPIDIDILQDSRFIGVTSGLVIAIVLLLVVVVVLVIVSVALCKVSRDSNSRSTPIEMKKQIQET